MTRLEKAVLALNVALVVALFGPGQMGTWRGRSDARRDIAAGIQRIKGFGLSRPWRERYDAIIEDQYGVHMDYVAGCVVDDYTFRYVRAYNEVTLPEIADHVGNIPFDSIRQRAREEYEKARGD